MSKMREDEKCEACDFRRKLSGLPWCRPCARRDSYERELIKAGVKVGDRVRAASGAVGTVVELKERRRDDPPREVVKVLWDETNKKVIERDPSTTLTKIPCDWPKITCLMGSTAHALGHPGCAARRS